MDVQQMLFEEYEEFKDWALENRKLLMDKILVLNEMKGVDSEDFRKLENRLMDEAKHFNDVITHIDIRVKSMKTNIEFKNAFEVKE